MTVKEETLNNLYAIRAGLSLVSRLRDELKRYKPLPAAINKRVFLEKALAEVDTGISFKEEPYATGRVDKYYKPEECRVIAVNCAAQIKPYGAQLKFLNDTFDISYSGHESEYPTAEAYRDSRFKEMGAYAFFDSWIEQAYVPRYWGKMRWRIKREEKRKKKFRDDVIDGILKREYGDYGVVRHGIMNHLSWKFGNTLEYAVYYSYKKKLVEERKKLADDGYEEYIDKLVQAHGSLKKALIAMESAIKVRTDAAVAICDVLYSTFNGFLPVTQWGDLDSLVYYVEEGYADTVKEALNLLLRQRQNDKIIEAVSGMEKRVTAAVNRGISSLRSEMNEQFCNLSGRLNEVYRQQSVTNAQLERTNRALDLNNALREKANATSRQLADDMSYFRSRIS